MWISAAIVFMVILGMFLSMLSSSPKSEPELRADREV